MADDLKKLMRQHSEMGDPPDFETVLNGESRKWRLSPKRVSLCLAFLAVIGIATFSIPQSGDDLSDIYVELPQTTDWLLDIPDEDWLDDIPTINEKG